MSEVRGIRIASVDQEWPNLAQWLSRALAAGDGEYTLAALHEAARIGKVQLWAFVAGDQYLGVAVTQVAVYPARKTVQMFLGAAEGGFSDEWLPWLKGIEAWAYRAQGVDTFEIIGRPGWEKWLEPHGYVRKQIVLRKELGDEFGRQAGNADAGPER
jgi:hypothetical protein